MKSSNTDDRDFNDLKCIWMCSNIIDYKLCDKNFDCENCIFDKVIRNLSAELRLEEQLNKKEISLTLLDKLVDSIAVENSMEKVVFLKHQFRAKHLFAETYYLGLNPVLSKLLDSVDSIKNFENKTNYSKGDLLFHIAGPWGEIPMFVPMDFTLVDKINFSAKEISGNNWFALISVKEEDIRDAALQVEELQKKQLEVIINLSKFKNAYQNVGTTMYDGGTKVSSIHQVIGSDNYLEILNDLLSI
jgi:hypothetical protein